MAELLVSSRVQKMILGETFMEMVSITEFKGFGPGLSRKADYREGLDFAKLFSTTKSMRCIRRQLCFSTKTFKDL
jgi:hypothetical protein